MARQTPLEKVRNIGIIAHIDAGKTTVTEGVLYLTGKTHKIGAVHEGETQMDWMEQEKERGITITSAATTCFWSPDRTTDSPYRINIIDTPGHVDFTAEVERSLRVLDGAAVIFDGKMGVESQSETVWNQANTYKVPRVCFINKINQIGGDFYKSLDSIHQRLSKNAYPIQLPIGFEKEINGVVDLVEMKSYTYKEYNDKELVEGEIPEDMKETVKEYREKLIEKVVECDDVLMDKYLGGEELTIDEIKNAIRKSTLDGDFFPVMGGDGRGVIVETLLDAVIYYLPSPLDVPPVEAKVPDSEATVIRKPEDNEPFSALVFKIAADPFVGKLAFFRVYSGCLHAGSYVLNTTTGDKERIGRIVRMHANTREEVDEVYAGEIAAAVGLKNTFTGHTICDENNPVILEQIIFPEPVISVAIEPKSKADQEKLGIALQKLAEEDPTFKVHTDEETLQTIISGMGELHLEILVDRMKREFKVEANIGKPQVAYRETLRKEAEAEGKYVKQSGGRGQYGHCWLRVKPIDEGDMETAKDGLIFNDEIKGGVIPREFIKPIEKGVRESMARGIVAGYPLVDVEVSVYDGSYHDVDSSEIAFKMAGSLAFNEAAKKANPVILEPVMKLEVVTPEEFMGDVVGDLNSRRGQIDEMMDRDKIKVIRCKAPLAEMFGYATDLRSLTQGRATASMEFSHYADVPSNVAEKIKEGKA